MVFGLKLRSLPKKATDQDDADASDDEDQYSHERKHKRKHKHDERPGKKEDVAPREPSGGRKEQGADTKKSLTVNEFVARTKKYREKGLEPTKPELIAYARYLGIDPITDADLMWIVDESLNAPLPSEWTEHHDSANRVFYYNVDTQASSWTHPLEQLHRDTYKNIVEFRSGDMTREQQVSELERLRRKCDEAEREAHRELQSWSEHVDEQGQKFYCNREKQCSVWTDPRPARCHMLYLQMKALRMLSKHCGQPTEKELRRPNMHELGQPGPLREEKHRNKAPSDMAKAKGGSSRDAQQRDSRGFERGRGSSGKDDQGFEDSPSGEDDMGFSSGQDRGRRKKKNREREQAEMEAERPMGMPSLPALGNSYGGGMGMGGGGLSASGRPPSRPGESTHLTRKKVNAGIRLEPLKRGVDLV